jgi:hypothetical protein
MHLSREDLSWAAEQGILSVEQAERLFSALEARHPARQRFDAANVAYYFGALLIIGAMSFFMTLGWEKLGGAGLFVIALAYAVAFTLAGRRLWHVDGLHVPGGLLVTVAVCMTPLAVYGLQEALGLWPDGNHPGSYRSYHVWVKSCWIVMELATVAACLVALRFFPFPFLTAPMAFSLWYLSMDLTPLLFGQQDFTWEQRKLVSLVFGLLMLLGSWLVDRRTKDDFAFWGYLFGLMAFWGALSTMNSGSELNKFLYCLLNVGLIALSVVLQRRVFAVFGALGVFGYVGYLAWDVFEDSMLFPFALTGLGLVVIFSGVQYQRRQQALHAWIVALLPARLLWVLPSERMAR